MRDLGFDEVVALSFTDPGMAGRLRLARRRPARARRSGSRNPLSEEQSVMRTTLLGVAARRRPLQPRPRRRAASRCSSPAASTCATATARRRSAAGRARSPASGPRPSLEPHRIAAPGGRARSRPSRLARAAAPGRLLRAQGRARGARRPSSGVALGSRPAARAVPASRAAAAAVAARRRATAGWLGELHPLVCRDWDLERRRRLRDRPRAAGRRVAGRRARATRT